MPIVSIGDVVQIGGYNCMYLGSNRYVYIYNLGSTTWANAITNARNWSVPSEITALYNVSDKGLMTKAEADGLPSNAVRQSLVTAANNYLWLLDVAYTNYVYAIYGGGYVDAHINNGIGACLTAFTIAKKHS